MCHAVVCSSCSAGGTFAATMSGPGSRALPACSRTTSGPARAQRSPLLTSSERNQSGFHAELAVWVAGSVSVSRSPCLDGAGGKAVVRDVRMVLSCLPAWLGGTCPQERGVVQGTPAPPGLVQTSGREGLTSIGRVGPWGRGAPAPGGNAMGLLWGGREQAAPRAFHPCCVPPV